MTILQHVKETIVTIHKLNQEPPLRRKLRLSEVARRQGVCRRTIQRWIEHHEETDFPLPVTVCGRHYIWEHELDDWDAANPGFAPVKKAAQ